MFKIGDHVKGFDGGIGIIAELDANSNLPWPIRVQYENGATGLYTEDELEIYPNKKQELWDLCQKFIKDNQISWSETVYQSDRVSENSYEFIDAICQIVGYDK